jgi:hypothetical protein
VAGVTALVQRLGLASLPGGQDLGPPPVWTWLGVSLAKGVSGCKTLYPTRGLCVGHRGRDIGEVAGIDRLGFDRAEISFEARAKRDIGGPPPAEDASRGGAELLEVLARGLGARTGVGTL